MTIPKATFIHATFLCALSLLSACERGESPTPVPSGGVDTSAPTISEHPAATPRDSVVVPGLRVGAVTASSSEADLIAIHGADYVTRGDVYVGEGEFESGTVLFTGTPNELEILWHDADRRCPSFVIARAIGSPWSTIGGVRVGVPLSLVEQENGAAFDFAGFDWDYQGYVRNWNGGKLQGTMLRFALPSDLDGRVPQDSLSRLGGTVLLRSDDPLVRMVNPVVQEIGLSWPRDQQALGECMQKVQN